MNEREAFCVAAKFYCSGEWSPALSSRNKIDVTGKLSLFVRFASMVAPMKDRLPDSIANDLLDRMKAQHARLQKDLVMDRSYATGAKCLLKSMDELHQPGIRRRCRCPYSFRVYERK